MLQINEENVLKDLTIIRSKLNTVIFNFNNYNINYLLFS